MLWLILTIVFIKIGWESDKMRDRDYFINNKSCAIIKNKNRGILEKIIKKEKCIKNKFFILDLLQYGQLDDFIKQLDNEKIIINHNTLIKKGYLTRSEHFVFVLDNFISYFIDIFNNIDLIHKVLPTCINSTSNGVFLSTFYLYDNDYLKYYTDNYNLIIIENFYYNLIKFKNELTDEIRLIGLELNDNYENIRNILFSVLEEICFVNRNHYALLSLFTKVDDDTYDLYLIQWKILFSNYFDNIDFVYAYRDFKKKNALL